MEDGTVGVVIELPTQIVCSNCIHHYEGGLGLFCGLFREEIPIDEVALECGEFEYGF